MTIGVVGLLQWTLRQLRRVILSLLAIALLLPTWSAQAEPIVHRVNAGETLSHIAQTYGVSVYQLISYNQLDDPNRIYVGQVLTILPEGASAVTVSGSGTSVRGKEFEWPLIGGVLTSRFGPRDGRQHNGIDLAAAQGTPVRAAAAGRVIYADWAGTYGILVMLDHGDGVITRYAHNSALYVQLGERVEVGQPIAAVGNTGRSSGPHLHFEIEVDGVRIDPLPLLPQRN